MRKSDIICPQCRAGYRRIEVASGKKSKGEYRCLVCDHLLEVFDGSSQVAIRLTVQPEKNRGWRVCKFCRPSIVLIVAATIHFQTDIAGS
jgi:hypothetical protein